MRGKLAAGVTVTAALVGAVLLAQGTAFGNSGGRERASAPLVDIYIRGVVSGRAPGKNAANVEIRWDFKCLGDRLGAATYIWTLKVVRRVPKPEQTRTVATGTSKTGSTRVQLPPGRWEPIADPFRCQTDRGAGSTTPEVGSAFVVPDYCAWSVAAARGRVGLEQRSAVKALRKGDLVHAGGVAFTSGRGSLVLASRGGKSTVRLAASSRVRVDARQCARLGGWKLRLERGRVTAAVAESDRRRPYEIETANVVTRSARAAWTVEAHLRQRKPWTRVTVNRGRVAVKLRGFRRTVMLRARQSAAFTASIGASRRR